MVCKVTLVFNYSSQTPLMFCHHCHSFSFIWSPMIHNSNIPKKNLKVQSFICFVFWHHGFQSYQVTKSQFYYSMKHYLNRYTYISNELLPIKTMLYRFSNLPSKFRLIENNVGHAVLWQTESIITEVMASHFLLFLLFFVNFCTFLQGNSDLLMAFAT